MNSKTELGLEVLMLTIIAILMPHGLTHQKKKTNQPIDKERLPVILGSICIGIIEVVA